MNGRPLKKTGGNRKRRLLNPCISGRGSFPGSDNCGFRMVQKRKRPDSKVVSWPFQGFLQRLRHSGNRGAVCGQAGKIQLWDHDFIHPRFFGISSCPRRKEVCPCHGQRAMAQENHALNWEGTRHGIFWYFCKRNLCEAAAVLPWPQSDRTSMENYAQGKYP